MITLPLNLVTIYYWKGKNEVAGSSPAPTIRNFSTKLYRGSIMQIFSIDEFLKCFEIAIDNIKQKFYLVKTIYESDGIPRERVFCYELYHQLRLVLSDCYQYDLHGELDKRGHLLISQENQKIPDFLIHIPGKMNNNQVIIEIKNQISSSEIFEDLNKIISFIRDVDYNYGILLIYNHTYSETLNSLIKINWSNIYDKFDKRIYLLNKKDSLNKLETHALNEIRESIV